MGKSLYIILSFGFCLLATGALAKPFKNSCAKFLMSDEKSSLNKLITYKPLSKPVIAHKWTQNSERREKIELADITHVNDPQIQKIIDYVHKRGGKVRLMKTRILDRFVSESPYFWVNLNPKSPSYLVPVIALDLTEPRALASLAHEFEHFKIWWDKYQLELNRGLDRESAIKAAVDRVWEVDMIFYGERRAVDAEMKMEKDFSKHVFNRPYSKPRPNLFWQQGYVNRITYPEFQAVRILLRTKNRKALEFYLGRMLDAAIKIREKALSRLPKKHQLISYWRDSSVIELLIEPYGADRLSADKTLERFKQLVSELCLKRTGDSDFCS